MSRFFMLVMFVLLGSLAASADRPTAEITLAKDEHSKPVKIFSAQLPKLYAFFKTNDTQRGDSIRGVWIAENVGGSIPNESKIDEATLSADEDDFDGAFSLTKPDKGWREGKYRVEIYVGDELAGSAEFSIEAPVK
jgi:hypothetical protein